MKIRKITGVFMLSFCSTFLFAQSLRVTADGKGRLGYMNEQGAVVIPCQYQEAHAFKNGVAKVKKGNKYGFVDAAGAIVLPLKYDQVGPFEHGVAKITMGKKTGFIAEDGKIVLPVEYEAVSAVNSHGKAWINKGGKVAPNGTVVKGKYGLFNVGEGVVIQPVYTQLGEFLSVVPTKESSAQNQAIWNIEPALQKMNGLARNTKDTLKTDCTYLGYSLKNSFFLKPGLLNGHGEILIPENTYDNLYLPLSGMARCEVLSGKKKNAALRGGYWSLADRKEAFEPEENVATYLGFKGGVALGISLENIFLIDKQGNKVIENLLCAPSCVEGKLVVVGKDRKVGVIDTLGQEVIPFGLYEDLSTSFSDGLIGVKKDGLWGLMNVKQELVVPCAYGKISTVNQGYYAAMQNGKFGMLHISGTQVVPFEYEDVALVKEPSPTHIWVKKNKLWNSFCIDRQQVSGEGGYTWVTSFTDGMAGVRTTELQADTATQNSVYIVDKTGRLLFPAPLPADYYTEACSYIRARGGNPMTLAEANRFMLYRTRNDRAYQLTTIVPESDWDF